MPKPPSKITQAQRNLQRSSPAKTARPVHANAGVEAKYRKQLQTLIAEMHGSVSYWVTAAYRKDPPRVAALVAADRAVGKHARTMQAYATSRSPSAYMQRTLQGLGKRWIERFDDAAPRIAQAYLSDLFGTSNQAFFQSLKDAGWTVNPTMTPAIKDAFVASLEENVGLIRSIPQQYLQQVQGMVMRSYSAGRDLEQLTTDLKSLYPKAQDRAVLIARDQSNKANAVVNRTRQLELGIEEARWVHSGAGKHPRESHLKASNDRRVYKIAQGCYIDGEFIQPGALINCRCTARPILPF